MAGAVGTNSDLEKGCLSAWRDCKQRKNILASFLDGGDGCAINSFGIETRSAGEGGEDSPDELYCTKCFWANPSRVLPVDILSQKVKVDRC